jgi:serine protease Do
MKKIGVRLFVLAALFTTLSVNAQVVEEKKEVIVEEKPVKKEMRQVIITNNGEKKEKIVVEVDGEKISINGKPLDEMDKKNMDVKIRKVKDVEALTLDGMPGGATFFGNDGKKVIIRGMGPGVNESRPMLGIATETNEKGAIVMEVTKESAAEKIGIQKGDIITKVGDDKIENPDDLSEAVQKHKAGDKVEIKYLRNGKEMKATAVLTQWKSMKVMQGMPLEDLNFDFKMDDFNMPEMPKSFNHGFNWNGNAPKMGLSIQDTEEGNGVKILQVESGSNADKAGLKKDDIITHIDDKAISSVDDVTSQLRQKKENPSVRFQINRNGKSQNVEVKVPKKIKTADL